MYVCHLVNSGKLTVTIKSPDCTGKFFQNQKDVRSAEWTGRLHKSRIIHNLSQIKKQLILTISIKNGGHTIEEMTTIQILLNVSQSCLSLFARGNVCKMTRKISCNSLFKFLQIRNISILPLSLIASYIRIKYH